jgi:mannose-6-phosphate isomerase-like protein (cupin superfamily)
MNSPQGWEEPGQTPEFDEYTVVLKGTLQVRTREELFILVEGNCILTRAGEWVQYSSPFAGGAEYFAICMPAFSPDNVHRDSTSFHNTL